MSSRKKNTPNKSYGFVKLIISIFDFKKIYIYNEKWVNIYLYVGKKFSFVRIHYFEKVSCFLTIEYS